MDIFTSIITNDTVRSYALAAAVFIVLIAVFGVTYRVLLRKFKRIAERTKTDIDDVAVRVLDTVTPPFYVFVAIYIALRLVTVHSAVRDAINAVLVIWLVYQGVRILQIIIEFAIKKKVGKDTLEGETRAAVDLLNTISRLVLWTIGFLLVLSNLGVNITSLIAGLGIGGIAVALAAQNILSDLFSSFAIHFDKPFIVGDFIIVGDKLGVVQKIGIKTTRIKALQGEELVMSNRELTNTSIQNFKKMQERRVPFTIGVVYGTPSEKLQKVPKMAKEIVLASSPLVRFDRAHFHKFGDFALLFEIVYYIATPDYNAFMDAQQAINLGIKNAFEREGIEMAFPTQTIHIARAI